MYGSAPSRTNSIAPSRAYCKDTEGKDKDKEAKDKDKEDKNKDKDG
jgi:uncharacterized membrane protein YukC